MAATTWDGLPISPDPPNGASIIVYRFGQEGLQFLILHRAHDGPDFSGDWAWTPPSGARLPNEPIESCAQRELLEETGLTIPVRATGYGMDSWAIYAAEAGEADTVTLDAEHDRYAWVTLETALARCLPEIVGEGVRIVANRLQSTR